MKNQKITTAAICLAAVFTTQVQAQETFHGWNGSTSDDWMTGANWDDGGVVPSGPLATAAIREGTPSKPNNTVLYNGASASLDRVFLGDGGDTLSGHLTVQSGATLTTARNMQATGGSVFISNGLVNATTGMSLTHTSTANLGGTFNGNLTVNGTASASINGTLNGNFGVGSTAMQYIGATGTVNGDVLVSTDDQMTVAGDVNGLFSVNGTGQAFIEATANILSDGADSWIYNTAAVTWNVGDDGSVGTLKTNRNETSLDAYDGEWRYDATAVDMVVVLDDYDSVAYGTTILGLQLVSGIQNESTFAGNVTFMLNGDDVTSDFTWDGAGTGSFSGTVVPEPGTYALLAGCFALASVMIRRSR